MALVAKVHDNKHYTVPKGKLLFLPNGETGYLDLGNCSEFNVDITVEKLDHYSSRQGLKVKDKSIANQIEGKASFTLDEMHTSNLALFFMTDTVTPNTQSLATGTSLNITAPIAGRVYFLGATNVSSVVVTSNPSGTTFAVTTDYTVNAEAGYIQLTEGTTITGNITVTFNVAADTSETLYAGITTGAVGTIHFVADPGTGNINDIIAKGTITPTGSMPFISDEFASFQCEMELEQDSSFSDGFAQINNRGTVS